MMHPGGEGAPKILKGTALFQQSLFSQIPVEIRLFFNDIWELSKHFHIEGFVNLQGFKNPGGLFRLNFNNPKGQSE